MVGALEVGDDQSLEVPLVETHGGGSVLKLGCKVVSGRSGTVASFVPLLRLHDAGLFRALLVFMVEEEPWPDGEVARAALPWCMPMEEENAHLGMDIVLLWDLDGPSHAHLPSSQELGGCKPISTHLSATHSWSSQLSRW